MAPRVFISYAWESDDYRLWVERLAVRLRQDGIDARLDKWNLQEGSIPDFMNREVRHADRVLVLCSPAYRTKVHLNEDGERSTGSGWEAGLLSSQIFANLGGARTKGVPVLTRGSWQEAAPDFLLGELFVDLSREEQFEAQYRELLRRLHGQTSQAPPLGPLPADLQPEPVTPLRGSGEPALGNSKDSPSPLSADSGDRLDCLSSNHRNQTKSQVFLSYQHVQPDEDLARWLFRGLIARGHSVFLDETMLMGTKWVEEISQQIDLCDYFVVLISKDSIRSDMMRQEVVRAHELHREREGRPRILPIRVDFTAALPYDLAAYLNPLQYALWRAGENDRVLEQLALAIEGDAVLPLQAGERATEKDLRGLFDLTDGASGAPLPQADHRLAESLLAAPLLAESGSLRPDSPFYVVRDADGELLAQILGQGTTTAVKGPRQYGKSSLLARAHRAAKERGLRSFYLDFQLVAPEHRESLDSLLHYLAERLARAFRAQRKVEEFWNPTLGSIESLTDFLGEAILEEEDGEAPLLILLDEVDAIFDRPYKGHFFGMVRGWHNRRAIEDPWVRLNLVLGHSTEPQLWIEDINQSPFNVAWAIRMEPFDRAQVADLNERHRRALGEAEVDGLLDFVGGHPYLVRHALYVVASRRWSLARLKDEALADNGPFGDHLRLFLWRLQQSPGLVTALRQAIHDGAIQEELAFERLKAAGLIRGATRFEARPSFDLYDHYFRRHL